MQGRIAHLKTVHKENVLIKYSTFSDIDTFLRWKTSEEKTTQTSFVQQCGTKKRKNEECTHYYCNRHGQYQPKGNGKRAIKSQGICKIDDECTAYMKVTKCLSNGTISVEYCTNHTHKVEIAHLRIPIDTRVSIASKLQEGVSIDKVLDDIRDNVFCYSGTRTSCKQTRRP